MVQRTTRRVNGSGSISDDAQARRWIGLVDLGRGPDGRRRRTKVRGRTRAEVRSKLDELLADRAAGVDLLARTTTSGQLATLWLERGIGDDLSDNTRVNYERILRVHVLPALGHMRVTELRSEHVEGMLDTMQATGKAGSTMRHALNLTRRVLRFGVARDVVARNVAEPVLPRRGPRAPRAGLSPEQARALLDVAGTDRLGHLLTVSLMLDLRPGEAAGLTWSRVDLHDSARRSRSWQASAATRTAGSQRCLRAGERGAASQSARCARASILIRPSSPPRCPGPGRRTGVRARTGAGARVLGELNTAADVVASCAVTHDPSDADHARTPPLTACSLCSGETLGDDDSRPGGQRRRLEDLQARGLTRVTWVECLDECNRGDVVVARPRRRSPQHSPVWFAQLAGDTATDELATWLQAGGPGESPVPRSLSALVVRRSMEEAEPTD